MGTVTDVLRVSCKEAHATTEKTLIGKLRSIENLHDYSNILTIFYGYYAPLEDRISDYITPEILPDITKRKRSSYIISDLHKLNYTIPLVVATELPPINSIGEAAGAMYVLEGSTLGGQHIAMMLEAKPVLRDQKDAMQFFRGYGDQNLSMWERFKNHIDSSILEEEVEAVVQSAIETFVLLHKWTLNRHNDRIKNN